MIKAQSKWSEEVLLSVDNFLNEGMFLRTPFSLIRELGGPEAQMLDYLMFYHRRVRRCSNYKYDDGWFYCTVDKVDQELGFNARMQIRLMNKLIDKGFIERKQRCMPPKRYFRVNYLGIQSVIEEDMEPIHPYDPEKMESEIEEELAEHTRSGLKANGGSNQPRSIPPAHTESGLPHAVLCNAYALLPTAKVRRNKVTHRTALKTHKLINHSDDNQIDIFATMVAKKVRGIVRKSDVTSKMANAKIETYASNVRDLILKGGYNKQRIKEVLQWYCVLDHYEWEYSPRIRKSRDLYTNFKRIEEAKQRFENGAGHDEKKEYFDTVTKVWFKRSFIDKLRSDCTREYGIERSITQDMLDVVLENQEFTKGHISAEAVAVG